jgi:hypothetical protein
MERQATAATKGGAWPCPGAAPGRPARRGLRGPAAGPGGTHRSGRSGPRCRSGAGGGDPTMGCRGRAGRQGAAAGRDGDALLGGALSPNLYFRCPRSHSGNCSCSPNPFFSILRGSRRKPLLRKSIPVGGALASNEGLQPRTPAFDDARSRRKPLLRKSIRVGDPSAPTPSSVAQPVAFLDPLA